MVYKNKNDGGGKTKKRKAPVVVLAILLVLILLTAAFAVFILAGGRDSLPMFGQPAHAYTVEGDVYALTLKPTGGTPTEEGLRQHYADALKFAGENGINTLVYEGKGDISVYWRDQYFPVAEEIATQDTLFNKLDPLALLCELAEGTGVQIWVQLDAYSAGNYFSEMKGKVASYVGGMAQPTVFFDAADKTYTQYLTQSLVRLPFKYPISGVVLGGLDSSTLDNFTVWNEALMATAQAVQDGWAENGIQCALGLTFNSTGSATHVLPQTISEMGQKGLVQYLLPAHLYSAQLAQDMAMWQAQGAKTIPVPRDNPEQILFPAALRADNGGAVYGSYEELVQVPQQLGRLRSTMETVEGTLPEGYDIPQTLQINYPAQDAKISTTGLFIMGNSNPASALYINGTEIVRTTQNGAFGVAVELQTGENTFTFTQDDGSSFVLNVTKPEPPSGGQSTPTPEDNTKEAEPGQAVRIVNTIATAMGDPSSDGNINETFYAGGVGVVQQSTQVLRYDAAYGRNVYTWAYQLTGGDWVLARNCEWVEGSGASAFTGLTALPDDLGEWLQFEGEGTPVAYLSYGNDTGVLKITMHDTSFALPAGFSSQYVSLASVEAVEDGVELTLQTKGIWGYSYEYENGTTRLFLKKPPVQGNNPAKPLEGVRVMLDPGHGGDDVGTPGLMWQTGPFEKNVNLALANTIAYRLRQLGAEVLMTRTDDTFVSLDDRLLAQTIHKPDFFLSIHHDSAELVQDLNEVTGMRGFYYHPYNTPPSADFAGSLISNLAPALGRTVAEAQWGYYYVTRTTVCPSVLFEYGFLVIPAEFEYATSPDGMYAAAVATANAIVSLVPQAPADSQAPAPDAGTPQSDGLPDSTQNSEALPPETGAAAAPVQVAPPPKRTFLTK